ncbi:MAG TPA: sugar phosphate isomerase/epimerase [Candidatus Sulfotelmatobacter sp.]|nr:sugar phosphate isomerase/epimerase [Candidatus Sulfotelmatobacter sp.]
MKIGCCWLYAIAKYGFPPSLPDTYRALEEIAGLGFKTVELEGVGEDNLQAVHGERKELKQRCDDLGLAVISFRPVLPDLVHPEKAQRFHALDLFKQAVEAATFFGCEMIQTGSYAPPVEFVGEAPYKTAIRYGQQFRVKIDAGFAWGDVWSWLTDSIGACTDEANRASLLFCLEPRVGEIVSTTDGLLRLMDAVDADNFGAVLDTAHLHAQKEILPLSVEKLGSRIYAVHAADNDGQANQHLGVGRGTVDWEAFFQALKKHSFSGPVLVDVSDGAGLDGEYRESKTALEGLAARLEI